MSLGIPAVISSAHYAIIQYFAKVARQKVGFFQVYCIKIV
jgi:hypothetical protein